jgi:hypothetical protein
MVRDEQRLHGLARIPSQTCDQIVPRPRVVLCGRRRATPRRQAARQSVARTALAERDVAEEPCNCRRSTQMLGRRQKYASTALVLEPLQSRTRGIADGLPLPFPLLIKTGSQRPARTRGVVVPVLDLLAQPESRARRNEIQKNPCECSDAI